MNFKEAQQLSVDELRKLSHDELAEILENHIEEDCTITFDDSNNKF